jgi:hypothetical protein
MKDIFQLLDISFMFITRFDAKVMIKTFESYL